MPVHNHGEKRCLTVDFPVNVVVFVGGPGSPVRLSLWTHRLANSDFTRPFVAHFI